MLKPLTGDPSKIQKVSDEVKEHLDNKDAITNILSEINYHIRGGSYRGRYLLNGTRPKLVKSNLHKQMWPPIGYQYNRMDTRTTVFCERSGCIAALQRLD